MRRFSLCAAAAAVAFVSAGTAVAADHPDLSGFWERRSESLQPRKPPAYTPYAQALRRPPTTGPEATLAARGLDLGDANCLPPAQPWMLTQSAPINIIQGEGETLLIYEGSSMPERVYTDGRTFDDLPVFDATLNGYSIGRWEGDEFVVETRGFADKHGNGTLGTLPRGPQTRLEQRFRLAAGGEELHATFTVTDPVMVSEPYVYDFVWYRDPPDTYAQVSLCDARERRSLVYPDGGG